MGKPVKEAVSETAAEPPEIHFPGRHLYRGTLEASPLPKEWKKLFEYVLGVREDVLTAIPDQRDQTDLRAFRRLKFTQGPFIQAVRNLMGKAKAQFPDADWPEYEDAFKRLAAYEFAMSQNLAHEASDWIYYMHGLVSAIYRAVLGRVNEGRSVMSFQRIAAKYLEEIEWPIELKGRNQDGEYTAYECRECDSMWGAGQPEKHTKDCPLYGRTRVFPNAFRDYKIASKLVRIALRVARLAAGTFHLRDSMLHIDPNTVKESSLEDGLKTEFLDALRIKEDFQKAIPINPHVLEDDKAIDKLDKKAGSTVFALRGLADKVKAAGKEVGSKVESAIHELKQHGFVPGKHIPNEANDWAWNAHEVISKLFDLATDAKED